MVRASDCDFVTSAKSYNRIFASSSKVFLGRMLFLEVVKEKGIHQYDGLSVRWTVSTMDCLDFVNHNL